MHIAVNVSKYYDWEPVPEGAKVTQEDIDRRRVKPAYNGQTSEPSWLMKVTKTPPTGAPCVTTILLPEHELIKFAIGIAMREHRFLTRHEAIGAYLQQHVMHGHAHKSWIKSFEVNADERDEQLFRGLCKPQQEAGNLDDADVEEMTAAYLEGESTDQHIADHLHKHFRVGGAGASK